MRKNVVGMATMKLATTGSMKVRPGEIIPTSSPPMNHTGMQTVIPLPPFEVDGGDDHGQPEDERRRQHPLHGEGDESHCTLIPSCW